MPETTPYFLALRSFGSAFSRSMGNRFRYITRPSHDDVALVGYSLVKWIDLWEPLKDLTSDYGNPAKLVYDNIVQTLKKLGLTISRHGLLRRYD